MITFATIHKPRGTDILSVRPTGILPVEGLTGRAAVLSSCRGGTTLRHMDETSMPRRRTHGLTLIELMVAVGILSMMILSFATIMTQSRKVVSASQGIMRANTAAEAIMQSFRDSVRRITQNGFLCIDTEYAGGISVPRLYLTTAGVADSKTMSESGTASFSCYGLCDANPVDLQGRILWHQEWIMRPGAGPWTRDHDIIRNADLSQVQSLPRSINVLTNTADDIDDLVNFLAQPGTGEPSSLNPSPTTLADIDATWQLLCSRCSNLTISWMDATGGSEMWYDKDNPQDANSSGRGIKNAAGLTEYNTNVDAAGNVILDGSAKPFQPRYRALWTKENQSNWPRAIRIRFSLKDPLMPPEFSGPNGMFYEVICPIAR